MAAFDRKCDNVLTCAGHPLNLAISLEIQAEERLYTDRSAKID